MINETLDDLLGFFDYKEQSSCKTFRDHNKQLDKGPIAERVLKGECTRAKPGFDGFKERRLFNFNDVRLKVHPKDNQ